MRLLHGAWCCDVPFTPLERITGKNNKRKAEKLRQKAEKQGISQELLSIMSDNEVIHASKGERQAARAKQDRDNAIMRS